MLGEARTVQPYSKVHRAWIDKGQGELDKIVGKIWVDEGGAQIKKEESPWRDGPRQNKNTSGVRVRSVGNRNVEKYGTCCVD